MRLLFEDPWTLFAMLLAALAVTGMLFGRTGRPALLVASLCLLASLALPFFLDYAVETPAEEVDHLLVRLASAAEQGESQVLIEALESAYNYRGLDWARMADAIESEMRRGRIGAVRLNGRQVSATAGAATARFVAVISGAYDGQTLANYPMRLELTLRQNAEGAWRISRVRRFELIGNTEREIDLLRP